MLELKTQELLVYDPNTGQHVSVPAFGASGGTSEERLAKLEAENADLKEALELLLSGVTDDG